MPPSSMNALILIIYVLLTNISLVTASGDGRGIVDPNFVVPNPKYKKNKTHDVKDQVGDVREDTDGDESTDHEDEEHRYHDDRLGENYHSSVKGILENSLRKPTSKTVRFMKKHHTHITTALIIYAFRKELWNVLVAVTTRPSPDGKGRIFKVSPSPTSILKILIFLDFMRKLLHNNTLDSLPSSSDGQGGSLSPRASFSQFFLQHLKGSQSAYVPPIEQHYTFERINDRYTRDLMALRKASGIVSSSSSATILSSNSTQVKEDSNTTVILLDLKKLDNNRMEALNDEVSFLLLQHRVHVVTPSKTTVVSSSNLEEDEKSCPSCTTEIIIILESPGGAASDFGLAASQIGRLRDEPRMRVTVCVDKVAASGGYMMACMASPGHLFAAPFAVVGSIGVLGQAVNIHNTLLSWGIQSLVFRGGKDKAPVGLIGEITQEGIDATQEMIDRAHVCFKRHVSEARPVLVSHLDKVTTGDIFLGYDALQLRLIDRLITSDEYIGEKLRVGCRVLKLIKYERPRFLLGSPFPMPLFAGAKYLQSNNQGLFDSNDWWRKTILNTFDRLKCILMNYNRNIY